jgi:hypothetical protein
MLHVFTDIGNAALWGASVLCLVFLAQYAVMEPTFWRNPVGGSIWGLTLMMLVIFIPSDLALADPAFTGFGASVWYRWLAIFTVILVFAFMLTRVVAWEHVRRRAARIRRENAQQPESERAP